MNRQTFTAPAMPTLAASIDRPEALTCGTASAKERTNKSRPTVTTAPSPMTATARFSVTTSVTAAAMVRPRFGSES